MDFSGVTVALYKTAVLDTTLVRINQQYPQIGVQITQETEFDHRNFNPFKVTTTDAEGKFSFPSLTSGDYNLVFWKNDWGIRYICSVKAIENENNNIGNIVLYPETIYNSTIVSEPTIFKSDHSYFILTDVNYTSSVEFQPRAQIFINPGCMVKFYGAVTTPEFTSSRDMWKITSSKEIYSTSPVTMDFDSYYSAVNFYGTEITLISGIVRYGSSGISTVNISLNDINYMVFRDCGLALTINQGCCNIEYVIISYCNGTGITYTSDVASDDNVHIAKCIISNNIEQRGIYIIRAGYYNINNCYFNNNSNYAISTRFCNGNINHNIFDRNKYHIKTNYDHNIIRSNEIHYNNFYQADTSIIPDGTINNINNNNFFGPNRYFIDIFYTSVASDVNAKFNYWNTDEVSTYLADAEDSVLLGIPCSYHIIYLPKLSNPIKDAGIQ